MLSVLLSGGGCLPWNPLIPSYSRQLHKIAFSPQRRERTVQRLKGFHSQSYLKVLLILQFGTLSLSVTLMQLGDKGFHGRGSMYHMK